MLCEKIADYGGSGVWGGRETNQMLNYAKYSKSPHPSTTPAHLIHFVNAILLLISINLPLYAVEYSNQCIYALNYSNKGETMLNNKIESSKLCTILLAPYITIIVGGYIHENMEIPKNVKIPKILLNKDFCTSFIRNIYPIYYCNSYRDVFEMIESIGKTIAEVSEVPYLSSDNNALTASSKINILSILGTNNILASIVTYHIDYLHLYNCSKEAMKVGKKDINADFVKNIRRIASGEYTITMQVPLFFKKGTFNIYNIEGDDSTYITKKMVENLLQKKVLNIHNRKTYNFSINESYDITINRTYDLFSHIAHIIFREAHNLFSRNKIYLARTKFDKDIYIRYSSFNFMRPLAIKIKHNVSRNRNRIGLVRLYR